MTDLPNRVFVKPGDGRTVYHSGARVPDAGAWLPDDTHTNRRLRDGDLVQAKPPKKTSGRKPLGEE